eukprot:GHVR01174029.1.p1 GENE.GHVR01174029.1~~GHVR01174029.1.p1  ORF type:complete len:125 (+),score=70.56 GHVR01174029.1:284-658(+)
MLGAQRIPFTIKLHTQYPYYTHIHHPYSYSYGGTFTTQPDTQHTHTQPDTQHTHTQPDTQHTHTPHTHTRYECSTCPQSHTQIPPPHTQCPYGHTPYIYTHVSPHLPPSIPLYHPHTHDYSSKK